MWKASNVTWRSQQLWVDFLANWRELHVTQQPKACHISNSFSLVVFPYFYRLSLKCFEAFLKALRSFRVHVEHFSSCSWNNVLLLVFFLLTTPLIFPLLVWPVHCTFFPPAAPTLPNLSYPSSPPPPFPPLSLTHTNSHTRALLPSLSFSCFSNSALPLFLIHISISFLIFSIKRFGFFLLAAAFSSSC